MMTTTAFAILLIALAIIQTNCQVISESDVGFPELEKGDHHDKSARVPLYIPGMCPENQLLYPGYQNNDWICDCQPSHVYFPTEDRCFPTYRQGPCKQSEYLILKKGEFNPICVPNPCKDDGLVWYENACYKLNEPGKPCKPILEGGGIFGVNSSTLELDCLIGSSPLALLQVPGNCPPGSQRDRANRCRQKF
ncbi:PREDICTED: uncharacterized protein LOC108566421 [Nicrophorus vespilloides]|uniref:Uncharacterized protein LOC108566421 n=1 Tax=Nicrophorus vespilloides TaxID=110193 RepID=A0ABM1N4L9_NICVS|nr:PREDICTED: uncharacterized protein LOC108566421 [Nicrophorus vespilloides]